MARSLVVVIEIPAWSFRKARLLGPGSPELSPTSAGPELPSVAGRSPAVADRADAPVLVTEFWSVLPCPFNYGFVPACLAEDGSCQDIVVLGPRLHAGARVVVAPRWCARFEDAGLRDDKWVARLDGGRLSRLDVLTLGLFFAVYTRLKQLRLLLAGRWQAARQTRWGGLELRADL